MCIDIYIYVYVYICVYIDIYICSSTESCSAHATLGKQASFAWKFAFAANHG